MGEFGWPPGLFLRIAEALEIPVYDPIIALTSEPVIQYFEKNYGVSRLDLAVRVLIGLMINTIEGDRNHAPALRKLDEWQKADLYYRALSYYFIQKTETHPTIESIALQYGINKDDLISACAQFLTPPPGKEPALHFHDQYLKITTEVIPQLGRISNQLSVEHVRAKLTESKKRQAFFQIGKNHTPVVS